MPSNSLRLWRSVRRQELDNVEAAHLSIGGRGPGRRYATLQLNYSYTLLLSANFQGFCRDLHTEAAESAALSMSPTSLQRIVLRLFTLNRKLDFGNPNPGNLGSDFNRFGLDFWVEVQTRSAKNIKRRQRLEELNLWRNAIS